MNRDPYDPYAPRRQSLGPLTATLLIAIGSLAIYGAISLLRIGTSPLFDPGAGPAQIVPRGELAPAEQSTVELFREASPSVVHVTTGEAQSRWFRNPLQVPIGTGSGFIWSDEGYIVTNLHVIAEGNSWEVTLADDSTYPARLVGYVEIYDLAVLKIDAPKQVLRPIRVGTSSDLLVGQRVFAIGNPFGRQLGHSLTTGIISGLGRSILGYLGHEIGDMIQTDAAINPGNSGGPLFDSAGRLIGVNTAILDKKGGAEGIGFAVSVDTVNQVVPMIIQGVAKPAETGPDVRAGLGVRIAPSRAARILGVTGVVIEEVLENSSAQRAGLRPLTRNRRGGYDFDVITGIDGTPIRTNEDLRMALESRKPGERIVLSYERGRQKRQVELQLQAID